MSRGNDTLERIAKVVERSGGDDDVRATTFVRGLALGALVGAAIAGSTIWQRRHRPAASTPDPSSTAAGSPEANEQPLVSEQDDGQGDRRR
jgi:hypothetical protein